MERINNEKNTTGKGYIAFRGSTVIGNYRGVGKSPPILTTSPFVYKRTRKTTKNEEKTKMKNIQNRLKKNKLFYLCHLKNIGVTFCHVESEAEMVQKMDENSLIIRAQGLISGDLVYNGRDNRIFSIITQENGEISRQIDVRSKGMIFESEEGEINE